MTAIALSAAPGTVDRKFTSELADALGIELVDLRPLEIDMARRCDSRKSLTQRWVGGSLFSKASLSRRELARQLREEILAIADQGDILIVSWSASAVLRERFPAARVAVTGDLPLRERNVMASLHYADIGTARFEVASDDALITRFTQESFGVDWQDGSLYDLVIDAGGPSKVHAAEAINSLLTARRYRQADPKFTLTPHIAGGHVQAMPSVESVVERKNGNMGKVFIGNDTVSLSRAGSHEEAIAKIERRMQGRCDKSN
jgi:cytidylate kinase